MTSRVYRGVVTHVRREPVAHRFSYPAAFCGFDLDELAELTRRVPWLGHNRLRPLALYDADYLTPGGADLRTKLDGLLGGSMSGVASVFLLTSPRVFGYVFNPVSVFWCLGADGGARSAVLQVANTYGEEHLYLMTRPQVEPGGADTSFTAEKEFFVSPFNDLKGEYRVRLSPPGAEVTVGIDLWREGRPVLTSRLWGAGVPITGGSLARHFPGAALATLLTRVRIARQALALRHGKGVRDLMKPRPSSPLTFTVAERHARGLHPAGPA